MIKDIKVYYNTVRQCYSVMDRSTGRVIAYADTVTLKDAKFKVGMNGRARELKENRHTTHAYVVGELIALNRPRPISCRWEAYYNPEQVFYFTNPTTGEALKSARFVYCGSDGHISYAGAETFKPAILDYM